MASHRPRRVLLISVLVALTWSLSTSASAATPEAAHRGNYRGECRRLTNQINHYEGRILPMAIERGNRGWEEQTNQHVARLWHRRADLCPEYARHRSILGKIAEDARQFAAMVAAAGKAAATYFSGGLMP